MICPQCKAAFNNGHKQRITDQSREVDGKKFCRVRYLEFCSQACGNSFHMATRGIFGENSPEAF